jgi:hypothetical protein
MAIIKVKGLYEGERLRACSDAAQLHWPRLYLLGNGHSRFEVNYERIIAIVYASFHIEPTAEDVRGWLREYADNFLLFLYEDVATGAMWAQWITAQENLATYRTAEDKRSPAPDEREIDAYRQAYIEQKRIKYRKTHDILKPLETIANHFAIPETTSVGEGVGDGVGVFNGVPPFSASAEVFRPGLRNDPVLSSGDDQTVISSLNKKQKVKEWTSENYVDYWNNNAVGFPQVRKLNPKRRAKLLKRIRDKMLTPDIFAIAIKKLHASNFCIGDNRRNWHATFDFVISEDKLPRLLDGNYDNIAKAAR